MASVCFYFQMHQPFRLRRYSVFDTEPTYFDTPRNAEILRTIAGRCYAPAAKRLLQLIEKHDGRFRVSFSITGTLAEQLKRHAPRTIELLQKLAASGCVEFLSETSHHSLAFLYSREEFGEQIAAHAKMIEGLFGQTPTVFRNTELIYNNDLAHYLAERGGYAGVLAEGADAVLAGRTPTAIYRPPHTRSLKLLLKHYRLSDDIAFRFSNRDWPEWPLTAEKFATWVGHIGRPTGGATATATGGLCNLFLDFETFGEHQWESTGIFEFLDALPREILRDKANQFLTVSQALAEHEAIDQYDVPHMISWADTERDLSAWLGNAMQSNALHELYKLEAPIKQTGDAALLEDWRRLTTSDHFYYMCTKYFADGDVHKYFNPYESPYDSYINFMNVLDNLRTRAGA